MEILRSSLTLIFLIIFILIILYAWRKRKSRDFKNASKLPLKDE
ncbi:MAG: CcoQ/FixQ family Cbb3-type cytochrome c oxidase assembly chaperone [Nitrosomonadales bacterium]|nr:CcoQ/FixQ family Cbb3-type cytochrome c oxidase assembly chaperone [Nitrosomonadales bacterium]MBT6602436.1 CcoQ/FixQ family Cbb3-type cytochrome c oxidase assembly chaperone [Nitrosomonadales bacterium]MBT7482590.1 CcoQ/FixQ family Cbb3-type cytochrome c oxidase assembly chaperone [Nitrosomonadales bacterium]MBT7690116.1 CcoQ/FixQ family Cbb3-type cytochrome c oxidase assembly chaperone [Nitrosomonadales bacterium]